MAVDKLICTVNFKIKVAQIVKWVIEAVFQFSKKLC